MHKGRRVKLTWEQVSDALIRAGHINSEEEVRALTLAKPKCLLVDTNLLKKED